MNPAPACIPVVCGWERNQQDSSTGFLLTCPRTRHGAWNPEYNSKGVWPYRCVRAHEAGVFKGLELGIDAVPLRYRNWS